MGRPRKLVILLGASLLPRRASPSWDNARGAVQMGLRSTAASPPTLAAEPRDGFAPEGARVLEVGCGPGHLSIRLARQHGLHTTALDLDPAMIERARANADRAGEGFGRLPPGSLPSFLVGDVASLPFPDGSFDLVVSTMSMHHWADPAAGLAEIARVLRPGARALVWVFRPGYVPLHGKLPDPVEHTRGTPLRMVSATPWRWPWRFSLTRRIELARAGE